MFDMASKKRRTYSAEQKADAVRLVRQIGSVAKVAKDLDLTETSLRNWVKQAEVDEGRGPEGALTSEERAELTKLRRENRILQQERDFLKKAAAFFAKEQDPHSR
jgi:transposase